MATNEIRLTGLPVVRHGRLNETDLGRFLEAYVATRVAPMLTPVTVVDARKRIIQYQVAQAGQIALTESPDGRRDQGIALLVAIRHLESGVFCGDHSCACAYPEWVGIMWRVLAATLLELTGYTRGELEELEKR